MRVRPFALVVAVVLAAGPAFAVQFVVTNVKDAVDAAIDGTCASTPGTCTLRAAIQEANATGDPDEIVLPAGKYVLKLKGSGENAAATGDLTLTRVVVGKNKAGDDSGGIDNDGGTFVIADSTVEANQAGDEAGGFESDGGPVAATNVTIAKNKAKSLAGGGLGAGDLPGAGKLKVKGLKANGGLIKTHALDPASPAVDAGLDAGCPPTDQRGLPRHDVPGVGTAVCDSGAYELQPGP